MFDCVSLTDASDCYQVIVPSQMIRESGLLLDDEAPLGETELAIDSPNIFAEYDAEERTITYHLPEPPEDKPDPVPQPKGLSEGEKAALAPTED